MDTPILFIIFNRPEHTQKVFEQIRKQQPKSLFIAADGPRLSNKHDVQLCDETRKIVSNIDWECNVQTLFHEKNLGCGLAPATAISWFFTQVDEGIILEDDCIPNQSFFGYCKNLLQKYKYNDEVMMICGTSYQPKPLDNNSYYFSKYPHVWGWATWKSAWEKYNFYLLNESRAQQATVINKTFHIKREQALWKNNMLMIENGLDAWDFQWMYWMWKNDGLCIIPWKNMISNIGFGDFATHTFDQHSIQADMENHGIDIIYHPKKIENHIKADNYERKTFLIDSFLSHVVFKAKFLIRKLINLY